MFGQTASKSSQVISEIDGYIRQNGGGYPAWYVGIATYPRDRLFDDHNVDEKNGAWIYRDCGSEAAARAVEKIFLAKGCDGGDGGGVSPRYVYAYKKTSYTKP